MTIGNATLGCAPDYDFRITNSCDTTPLFRLTNVCAYKYNRIVDKISNARVSFAVSDTAECRRTAEQICLGRHYLTIVRNGCVEWKGPIKRMEFADDQINLFASDPLWWTTRRVAPPFYATPLGGEQGDAGAGFLTPADLFIRRILDLFSQDTDDWAEANNLVNTDYDSGLDDCGFPFEPLCFDNVFSSPTPLPEGAIDILTSKATKFTTVFKVLQELAKSVIDYTVVGGDLLFGYPSTPIPEARSQAVPFLTNKDWCTAPRIVRDIEYLANEVFVNTKLGEDARIDDILYENGGVRVQDCSFLKHGYHQAVIDRTSVSSTEEAVAAGESFLEHNNRDDSINYIENTRGTQLADSVQWDLPRMVPGMRVDVSVDEFGFIVDQSMRLHEVIVEGNPRQLERVKITLEPLGVGSA